MKDKSILTRIELTEYITSTLMALRQDVEADMADDDAQLAPSDPLYAILHELAVRFELAPAQQMQVLGRAVYEFHTGPACQALLEPALNLLGRNGSGDATPVVAI
jgi:hypothetical protein